MVLRNVIIFGDPAIDTRFVLERAGASVDPSRLPPKIFEAERYSVTIADQQYALYNTAGLPSPGPGGPSLQAREVLGNLHRLIRSFDGGINLLIYAVRTDKPTLNNLSLFFDYLCQRDAPIILVQTTHRPSDAAQFRLVLTLDGADPESDRVNLQKAIARYVKKTPRSIDPTERFKLTARGSWKLLEKRANWSLADCRDALKFTFVKHGFFSEKDADGQCESIVESIKKRYFCNVIVFGDTGAGKTSVIKMLTDEVELDIAKAASAGGSTFESKAYEVDINEYHYVFHDTVGLEDGTSVSLSPHEALTSLHQLILKVEGGVSLLVYVHRGKIKPSQVENYKLFSHVICKSEVPTVLVVTGLEEEESTDDWWQANKALYEEHQISTDHHACITSTKGRFNPKHQEFVYQDQYEESKTILKNLFLKAPLLNPWKITSTPNWWKSLVVEIYNIFAAKFSWRQLVANKALYHDLIEIGGMEDHQAKNWANNMNRVLPTSPTGTGRHRKGALSSESTKVANKTLYHELVDPIGTMEDHQAKDWSNNVNRLLPTGTGRPYREGASRTESTRLGDQHKAAPRQEIATVKERVRATEAATRPKAYVVPTGTGRPYREGTSSSASTKLGDQHKYAAPRQEIATVKERDVDNDFVTISKFPSHGNDRASWQQKSIQIASATAVPGPSTVEMTQIRATAKSSLPVRTTALPVRSATLPVRTTIKDYPEAVVCVPSLPQKYVKTDASVESESEESAYESG